MVGRADRVRQPACAPARHSRSSSTTGSGLYGEILERAGLQLESRTLRHVNRRTGRRAGEYFEEILVARAALSRR